MLITDKDAGVSQTQNKIHSDEQIGSDISLMLMTDEIAFFYSRASRSNGTVDGAIENKNMANPNNLKHTPSRNELNNIASSKVVLNPILQSRKEKIIEKIMKLKR